MNDTTTREPIHNDTDTTATGHRQWRHGHGCHHGRRRHADLSELSGPQRLVHRLFHTMGAVVMVVLWMTIVALGIAATIAAWRWIFDVMT